MKARHIIAMGLCIVLSLWLGSIGCESNGGSIFDNENGSDSDGDSDGDGDGDGDDDDNDNDDGWEDDDDDNDDTESDSGQVCEEEIIDIVKIPSRLLVLEDISTSMIQDQDGTPVEKWNQARAAIINLAEKFEAEVDLGLDFFPDGSPSMNYCGISAPVMSDTAPLNGQAIIDALNATNPEGNTPLYNGMNNFTQANYAPNFTSDEADSYLCVVSDGADTCGVNGGGAVTPADLTNITSTLLNTHGISTFVIGFGDGVNPAELNAIAAAGGTEYTEYLIADDQASLEEAFAAIISSIVSCIYQLEITEPNVDPTKVNFYFITLDDDGNEIKNLIPYDEDCNENTGWHWVDFDNFIVEFCQEACDMLQTGEVIQIIAEFGCDVVVV